MRHYTDQDIILDERASRSFLHDLFCQHRDDSNRQMTDPADFCRKETENGVTYHFPDTEIHVL